MKIARCKCIVTGAKVLDIHDPQSEQYSHLNNEVVDPGFLHVGYAAFSTSAKFLLAV